MVENLEIKNFKSIKELKLDCKQINLFIGEPNVGKSNILEAIALLGGGYSTDTNKFFSDFIRYQELSNLFYDDDISQGIQVKAGKFSARLTAQPNNNLINYSIIDSSAESQVQIQSLDHNNCLLHSTGLIAGNNIVNTLTPFKKYDFKGLLNISDKTSSFLLPPDGSNLFTILDHNKELKKEIGGIFKKYGLQMLLSKKDSIIELQKVAEDYSYKYPFANMADTYKRLIFYLCALDSNKDSVLILEEPEVHSFPPYTKWLADIIAIDDSNQYFIATHSPYLLTTLIEEVPFEKLNVFITYFEDYETKLRALTLEELNEITEHHYDIFFNLDKFIGK